MSGLLMKAVETWTGDVPFGSIPSSDDACQESWLYWTDRGGRITSLTERSSDEVLPSSALWLQITMNLVRSS